jgi:hypothetical protein
MLCANTSLSRCAAGPRQYGAHNGAESQADALDITRRVLELGGADRVRGDFEQQGLSLGVLGPAVGEFTAEGVELGDCGHLAPQAPLGTGRLSIRMAYIRARSHRLQTDG